MTKILCWDGAYIASRSRSGGYLDLLIIPLGLLLTQSVAAQSVRGSDNDFVAVSLGYGNSDNVARSPTNIVSSDMMIIGLDANWNIEKTRYEFGVRSDIEYIRYSEDAIENRPSGDVDISLIGKIIPERLEWFLSDTFSQIRQDPTLGSTPQNLREFNVVSTGLTFGVPFGRRTTFGGVASIGDRHYPDLSDLNSTEVLGGLNLTRQIDPLRRIGLNANGSRIEYDNDLTSYDITRVFLRYESVLSSGEVMIDLGADRIQDRLSDQRSDTEPLVRFAWQRDVFSRSRLEISAGRQFIDLGSSANPGDISGIDPQRPDRLTPDSRPFEETRGDVLYLVNYSRTNLSFGASYSYQDFEDSLQQDARFSSIGFRAQRSLGGNFGAAIGARIGRIENQQTVDDSDELSVAASVFRDFSDRYRLIVQYQFYERSGDPLTAYRENLFRIDLSLRIVR